MLCYELVYVVEDVGCSMPLFASSNVSIGALAIVRISSARSVSLCGSLRLSHKVLASKNRFARSRQI